MAIKYKVSINVTSLVDFQALEKAQSDFDRLQEKLERCQNDSRRVSGQTFSSNVSLVCVED